MTFKSLLFMVAIGTSAVSAAARGDPGDERYRLPLFDPYAVLRSDREAERGDDRGAFQLVEETGPARGGGLRDREPFLTLIPDLQQVGVEEGVIFGRSAAGFFIVDARQQPAPRPELFDTRDAWHAALDRFGVTATTLSPSPDALAALQPPHVLRPWKYRTMGGALGLSDDGWAVVAQTLGLAAAFCLGLLLPANRGPPIVSAVALGLLSNVGALAQIGGSRGGGGGGAGVAIGFVIMPILCLFASMIGQAVRGRVGASSGRSWADE
jgi:hypothetical protein